MRALEYPKITLCQHDLSGLISRCLYRRLSHAMTDLHPALLPNGLADLLPDEAEAEAAAINSFMAGFASFGYARVKPPLVEFEDSLLAPGPGAALSRQTFRLMDPVSQRMMGLRADTTAQIGRIATSRLAKEKQPLRLSYAADVLRVNGTQLRPARQFCQVGCELIGSSAPRGDAEVMLMALKGLNDIGLKNLSIDLTLPSLVGQVYEQAGTPEDKRREISDVLKKRDRSALEKIKDNSGAALVALLDACGPAKEAVQKIKAIKHLPKEAGVIEQAYESLSEALSVYGLDQVNVTADFLEHRGLDYETGISFTLFAAGVRGELGGGGRYRLTSNGVDESATGFTLYMDSILPALPRKEKGHFDMPDKAGWADIKKAQDKFKG